MDDRSDRRDRYADNDAPETGYAYWKPVEVPSLLAGPAMFPTDCLVGLGFGVGIIFIPSLSIAGG